MNKLLADDLNVTKSKLIDYGRDNLKLYGLHTIKDRAMANLMDGMKPVQRRILWGMFKQGLTPDKKVRKAAKTVGDVMGNYHPHGDSSIYEAMTNMFGTPEPLIDGAGSNWGSVTDQAAAMRYTEARLSQFAYDNFFADPAYLATLDMMPNYDGNSEEPVALSSKTCHLFVLGQMGIAVGVTSKIPTFTLASVNKFLIKALESGGRISAAEGAKILKFVTTYGGHVADIPANAQAFKDLLTIGRGSILFHPDYKLENRGRTLVLTGVPMLLRSGTKFENLAALTNVAQYVDETTIETGIRIVVEAKRGVVWNETTMKPVLNLFSSRVAFRINYLMETTTEVDGAVVVDSKLVSNGVIDAMYDWIELRKEQFDKAMVWRIAQEEKKLHRVDLQLLAHKKRDVLDACRDKPDPKAYLMKQLGIDDKDADYLLGMTVMQLTRINKEKLEAKAKEHKGQIATFKDERKRPVEGLVKELKQLA